MKYLVYISQMTNSISSVFRLEECTNLLTSIPLDNANTDYQQYLAWLAEGNEPEEWTDGN